MQVRCCCGGKVGGFAFVCCFVCVGAIAGHDSQAGKANEAEGRGCVEDGASWRVVERDRRWRRKVRIVGG